MTSSSQLWINYLGKLQASYRQVKLFGNSEQLQVYSNFIAFTDPSNAGIKSCVLSWLKRKWEEEQNDSD